jgi:hypothetical protein
MITTVVAIMNSVTVIGMTANTADREGLQMKRMKLPGLKARVSWCFPASPD